MVYYRYIIIIKKLLIQILIRFITIFKKKNCVTIHSKKGIVLIWCEKSEYFKIWSSNILKIPKIRIKINKLLKEKTEAINHQAW